MRNKLQSWTPIKQLVWNAFLVVITLIYITLLAPAEASSNMQTSDVYAGIDLEQDSIIQEGKARFVQTCAYCHGQEGEAGKTRPFKTHTNWEPQAIFDTISNGRVRGGNVMPTWKDAIPPEEIWKIVAYIRSLSASKNGPP
jgi:mono/diheme cytochrome c family protein